MKGPCQNDNANLSIVNVFNDNNFGYSVQRDYLNLLAHRDDTHLPIFKTRRCFLYQNQQYQLDIYRSPCHSRCKGLILLETFTTLADEELIASLPPFLRVKRAVTGDPAFSMYNLSIRSEWEESVDQFCHRLSSDDEDSEDEAYDVKQAHERLVTLAVLDDDNDSGMSDSGDSVLSTA